MIDKSLKLQYFLKALQRNAKFCVNPISNTLDKAMRRINDYELLEKLGRVHFSTLTYTNNKSISVNTANTKSNNSKSKNFSRPPNAKDISQRYYKRLFVSLYTSRKILVFYKGEEEVCDWCLKTRHSYSYCSLKVTEKPRIQQ